MTVGSIGFAHTVGAGVLMLGALQPAYFVVATGKIVGTEKQSRVLCGVLAHICERNAAWLALLPTVAVSLLASGVWRYVQLTKWPTVMDRLLDLDSQRSQENRCFFV